MDAAKLVGALTTAGLIDAKGNRLYQKGELLGREDAGPLRAAMASAGVSNSAKEALARLWATHQMRSDYVREQIAFFDKHFAEASGGNACAARR